MLHFAICLVHSFRIFKGIFQIWMKTLRQSIHLVLSLLHNSRNNSVKSSSFIALQNSWVFFIFFFMLKSKFWIFSHRFIDRLEMIYRVLLTVYFTMSMTGICSALLSLNEVFYWEFSLFYQIFSFTIFGSISNNAFLNILIIGSKSS